MILQTYDMLLTAAGTCRSPHRCYNRTVRTSKTELVGCTRRCNPRSNIRPLAAGTLDRGRSGTPAAG